MVLERCKWEGAAVSSALGHSVETSMGQSYGRRARAGSWQGGSCCGGLGWGGVWRLLRRSVGTRIPDFERLQPGEEK